MLIEREEVLGIKVPRHQVSRLGMFNGLDFFDELVVRHGRLLPAFGVSRAYLFKHTPFFLSQRHALFGTLRHEVASL